MEGGRLSSICVKTAVALKLLSFVRRLYECDRGTIIQERRKKVPEHSNIFERAHRALMVDASQVVHICASPHHDLAAARDIGFRCIWIDRGTGRKGLADYVPSATLPTLDKVPACLNALGWC